MCPSTGGSGLATGRRVNGGREGAVKGFGATGSLLHAPKGRGVTACWPHEKNPRRDDTTIRGGQQTPTAAIYELVPRTKMTRQ